MLHRQGDVLLEPLISTSFTWTGAKRRKKIVLALGEKTGHSHVLESEKTDIQLIDRDGVLFLKTNSPTILNHQEHAAHDVKPGLYRVRQQKEHTARGARRIVD